MSASVWRRVLIAVVLAAGLIVILQVAVQSGSGSAAAATAEPPLDTARLPAALRRRALLVYLVADAERLPSGVAPAVEVLADGGIEVRRAPPFPDGPEPGPWLAAGVILPAANLAELTGVQRAALLSACEGFSGGAALDPDAVVGLGVAVDREQLRGLLRWLR